MSTPDTTILDHERMKATSLVVRLQGLSQACDRAVTLCDEYAKPGFRDLFHYVAVALHDAVAAISTEADMTTLRAQIETLPRRIEPLGGQQTSYVQLDNVLALLELAHVGIAEAEQVIEIDEDGKVTAGYETDARLSTKSTVQRSKKNRPSYAVMLMFENEAEAREFAIKVMEIPAPGWAVGICQVAEYYPK